MLTRSTIPLKSQRAILGNSVDLTLPRRAAGCSCFSFTNDCTGCAGLFEDPSMPKNDGKTPQQRFAERYTINPITGCWNWMGSINSKGYAYLWVPDEPGKKSPNRGRTLQAYKLGWIWKNGPILRGMDLHHKCDNPRCVNPDHLELLTRAEHQRISWNTITGRNYRKRFCIRGHEFTPANTRRNKNGGRVCKLCEKARQSSLLYKTNQKKYMKTYQQKNKGGQGAV